LASVPAASAKRRASRSFANTPAGHKALIAWAGHGVTWIVFEPTGP